VLYFHQLTMQDSESSLDDCVYHFVCPCCTLSQVIFEIQSILNLKYNIIEVFIHIVLKFFNLCNMMQESRTLEMNNVQNGTWHGRGDTNCIGGFGEKSKSHFELLPPPIITIKSINESGIETKTKVNPS